MADTTVAACPESAVLDVMFKSAVAGAALWLAYSWAVNEGVIGAGFGSRAARHVAGRVKGMFV
jgi:hypothetical protein